MDIMKQYHNIDSTSEYYILDMVDRKNVSLDNASAGSG